MTIGANMILQSSSTLSLTNTNYCLSSSNASQEELVLRPRFINPLTVTSFTNPHYLSALHSSKNAHKFGKLYNISEKFGNTTDNRIFGSSRFFVTRRESFLLENHKRDRLSKQLMTRSKKIQATVGSGNEVSEKTSNVTESLSGPPKLMLVSDLDFTMVDHKDPSHSSLRQFNALWESKYAKDSLLVFSTGRSPTAYKAIASEVPLLTPGITILSVGTEILYGESMTPDSGWLNVLNENWNREEVVEEATKFPSLRWQTESEQRPHKVSFHVEKSEALGIIETLRERLQSRGLKVNIIYSGGYDLDLLPERAGKGKALSYLLNKLQEEERKPLNTLACGDSGNDQELFTVAGAKGVIVGNAMEELVQWYEKQSNVDHLFRATERCAGGIIEAINHFEL